MYTQNTFFVYITFYKLKFSFLLNFSTKEIIALNLLQANMRFLPRIVTNFTYSKTNKFQFLE